MRPPAYAHVTSKHSESHILEHLFRFSHELLQEREGACMCVYTKLRARLSVGLQLQLELPEENPDLWTQVLNSIEK